MLSYCLKCRKNTESKNPKVVRTKNRRIMLLSKCTVIKMSLKKGDTPNWSEEVFVIKKVKNIVPWTYVINDLNGEEIVGTFYEKELQKTNQKEFRIGKVSKRKVDKLYVT